MVTWLERHQVPLYLVAIVVGLAVSPWAGALAGAITPVLGLLLFATFLSVPLTGLRVDLRFAGALALLNFVVVPAVVVVLTLPLRDDAVLLTAVLLVLLTPCIDYVIVFTGLAGGARERLLAATPLLLVAQMLLLPLYLRLFLGREAAEVISAGPFLGAFFWLILLPLAAAWLVQIMKRHSVPFRQVSAGASAAMVPLMMVTLFVVIAAHAGGVGEQIGTLGQVVLLCIVFAFTMNLLGLVLSRFLGFPVEDRIALIFSGVTRNSLVVMPFALALPVEYALAPVVVVTQTLVELVVMVVMVRALPLLRKKSVLSC